MGSDSITFTGATSQSLIPSVAVTHKGGAREELPVVLASLTSLGVHKIAERIYGKVDM